MVIEIPTKPHKVPDLKQRDVRETPASTATATAVGLTGESYVLVGAGSADLTAERTLTAGTGVSVTDAGAGTTVTLATIDGDIVHDNLSGFVANEHLDWTTDRGATNIHAGNYIDTTYTANETNITLVGTEFRLKNKTSYWSCSGSNFQSGDLNTEMTWSDTGTALLNSADNSGIASVELPHGAVVTGVIVDGNASLETNYTYVLTRMTRSDNSVATMGTAACGTEDTSIDNATIDNSTYCYFIVIPDENFSDAIIYGARITYTTDYI